MTTPHLLLRYARPGEIILGRVSLASIGGRLELRFDPHAHVDPSVFDPLAEAGERALADLVPLLDPKRPPVIRYYLERHIPGGKLVAVEVGPYQADVHLAHGLMSQDLADDIAGLSTHLMHRIATL